MSQRSRNVTDEGPREQTTVVLQKRGSVLGKIAAGITIIVGLLVIVVVLAAVHLLPQLRKVEGLGIAPGKEIEPPEPVEITVRQISAPELREAPDTADAA